MSVKRRYPFTTDCKVADGSPRSGNEPSSFMRYPPVKQQCTSFLLAGTEKIYSYYRGQLQSQDAMEIDHQNISSSFLTNQKINGSSSIHESHVSAVHPDKKLSLESTYLDGVFCNNNNTPEDKILTCQRCLAGESGHFNHLES